MTRDQHIVRDSSRFVRMVKRTPSQQIDCPQASICALGESTLHRARMWTSRPARLYSLSSGFSHFDIFVVDDLSENPHHLS